MCEACFPHSTGCPGIAVPPGVAHFPFIGDYILNKQLPTIHQKCQMESFKGVENYGGWQNTKAPDTVVTGFIMETTQHLQNVQFTIRDGSNFLPTETVMKRGTSQLYGWT